MVLLLALMASVLGCGVSEEAMQQWQLEKEQLRVDIEAQIETVEAHLEQLRLDLQQASDANTEALQTEALQSRMHNLEQDKFALQRHLDELAYQTQESWEQWTAEVNQTMDAASADLRNTMKG
jgi:hypothetical protein